MKFAFVTAIAVSAIAMSADAQVYDTSLTGPSGAYGLGTAVTTVNANGTSTTVTGPGGGANRASSTASLGNWFMANVGGGGTVGITKTYANNGNGSAYFSTVGNDSKADLQYYFTPTATPILLSSLTAMSFDFYRAATSGIDPNLAPAMRLDVRKDGVFAGSLVLETYYTTRTAAATNAWTTVSADLTHGTIWATKDLMGPTFAAANGGQKTFAEWLSGNAGSTISVFGMSIGVGSGWSGGNFVGAVDNVHVAFAGGPNVTSNFEVLRAGAVPEPASWAMMLAGFGLVGGAIRRRRIAVAFG